MEQSATQSHRQALKVIFDAAICAVAPDEAVHRHIQLDGDRMMVAGEEYSLKNRRLWILGAGKGAAPMARAVEGLLGERIHAGLVVVKYDHGLPLQRIELREASHPMPDTAGVNATMKLLDMARAARSEDLTLCLFTGGASALTPAPVHGLALEHLQHVTSLLLECGATIHEINALRKHLSQFSGGQLARAINPAQVLTLIVSDVIGDDLDVIASGPTAPDAATFDSCMATVRHYGLEEKLPQPVRDILHKGLQGQLAETPKAQDPIFQRVRNVLVATNQLSLQAARQQAEDMGFEVCVLPEPMQGEARHVAEGIIAKAKEIQQKMDPGHKPVCVLAGGETTVSLRGKGRGGRNQEMALAAALAMEGQQNMTALFAGTDGTDGPTEAAGGFAGCNSAQTMRRHVNPQGLLENNDSYTALCACGDLLITGPTRTNVMDLALVLVYPL